MLSVGEANFLNSDWFEIDHMMLKTLLWEEDRNLRGRTAESRNTGFYLNLKWKGETNSLGFAVMSYKSELEKKLCKQRLYFIFGVGNWSMKRNSLDIGVRKGVWNGRRSSYDIAELMRQTANTCLYYLARDENQNPEPSTSCEIPEHLFYVFPNLK